MADSARTLEARCLVIAGSGPVFSAGYDLGNLEEQEFEEAAERLVAHPFHAAIEALEAYDYPVLAQINGHAIGGGLELALTCDIRVAARGVKLGMPPAKLGLIYSHTGLSKFLDACGPANTAELFYVGRSVEADRAERMGLVNAVVEPEELDERVLDLAGEIAANAPLSLAGNKRIIRTLREIPSALPDDIERELVELRESCFRTEDFREGVRAFAEKRKPRWKGR
jgi:enoyl-CoA hydratase/carnithine racemase